jgi:hypothetical protein
MDETTLGLLDRLASQSEHGKSRSALVRKAVREFAARHLRLAAEERERTILRRHRFTLRKEAEALLREQAEP